MSDTDFASFVDNNTPYVSADTIDEVIKRLEAASVKLLKWFADDQMKVNQDKCHLIVSKNENISVHIGRFQIKNTNCETLLGIKVDSRLEFNEHLDGIMKKSSCKTNALSRTTPFMNISKKRILMNSFFNSQFNLIGCLRVILLTKRLTVYMKVFCVLYVMILSHPSKIF